MAETEALRRPIEHVGATWMFTLVNHGRAFGEGRSP
jgi:hypothetical protein